MERLQALHYDAGSGTFRDYGLHTEAVEMVWRDLPVPEGQPPQVGYVRVGLTGCMPCGTNGNTAAVCVCCAKLAEQGYVVCSD